MNSIEAGLELYFSKKLKQFGPRPKGVDWKDKKSQENRFAQLLKLFSHEKKARIVDLGCGYGALYSFLRKNYRGKLRYTGYDISSSMVQAAQGKHDKNKNFSAFHLIKGRQIKKEDYIVASGIFNNKGRHSKKKWMKYIKDTLKQMNKASKKGFAFNILTQYSDPPKRRKDLFYADPLYFFDFCKQRFSTQVALLHDYGLYEFTVLVRKG